MKSKLLRRTTVSTFPLVTAKSKDLLSRSKSLSNKKFLRQSSLTKIFARESANIGRRPTYADFKKHHIIRLLDEPEISETKLEKMGQLVVLFMITFIILISSLSEPSLDDETIPDLKISVHCGQLFRKYLLEKISENWKIKFHNYQIV